VSGPILELERPINRDTVEAAYRYALDAQKAGRAGVPEAGLRLARQRHDQLLKVLDQGAEVLDEMVESQRGRTRRDWGTVRSERAYPTEAGLWRAAYETADAGQPVPQLGYIYGAAAWLAGLYKG
jgi:hypothetical protein